MFSQFWPLKESSADTKVASQLSFSDGPTKALLCELCGEAFLGLAERSNHLEVMHPADPDENVLLEDRASYRIAVEAVSKYNQRPIRIMGRYDVEPKESRSTSPSPSTDCRILNPHHAPESFSSDIFLDDDIDSPSSELLRDLETRSITVSQLIQEVKGIYAGLGMVEKKCVEIVNQQAQHPARLSNEQWHALIAL